MSIPRPVDHAPIVARLLPGNWALNRIKTDDAADAWHKCAYIHDKAKPARLIWLMKDWHKPDRLRIAGYLPAWPTAAFSRVSRASIGVSARRPSEQIAREIERRFLPCYLEEWDQAEKYRHERQAEFEAFRLRVEMVRQLFPELRQQTHVPMTDYPRFYIGRMAELELSHYSAGTRIKLELSFGELLQVLHLLKANREQGRVEG
ncbi:peptidase S45 penicillin amidase [Tepidicaulis marinus]|uniref:Peptidase S45 penicillin amidase n=1 Tax=Tepidicaulis marinus TaxID=1333998 RepID=A0A081BF21_9HYPH|nr:hypothetical protein [Tepidicaulis marinus]GAK46639.1 peptidase S45 penicillin amidase [Tepidicaulis marinus]